MPSTHICNDCETEFNTLTRLRLHDCEGGQQARTDDTPSEEVEYTEEAPKELCPDTMVERPLTHNETLDLWDFKDSVLTIMPKTAPANKEAPEIARMMVVTKNNITILEYNEETGWGVIKSKTKPPDVFRGHITSEDHNHPEVEEMMDLL
jgi:hypothetical protein